MDALTWLRKQLEEADVDLLREMVSTFVHTLMGAEADAVCGALYGERSTERVNRRNGYRARDLDTRVGTMSLAIPKLREGSYFPDWRGRRGMDSVPAGVGGPGPVGRPPGDLRRPPGPRGGHRRGAARGQLAEVPDSFHAEPPVPGPPEHAGRGGNPGPLDLRPAL